VAQVAVHIGVRLAPPPFTTKVTLSALFVRVTAEAGPAMLAGADGAATVMVAVADPYVALVFGLVAVSVTVPVPPTALPVKVTLTRPGGWLVSKLSGPPVLMQGEAINPVPAHVTVYARLPNTRPVLVTVNAAVPPCPAAIDTLPLDATVISGGGGVVVTATVAKFVGVLGARESATDSLTVPDPPMLLPTNERIAVADCDGLRVSDVMLRLHVGPRPAPVHDGISVIFVGNVPVFWTVNVVVDACSGDSVSDEVGLVTATGTLAPVNVTTLNCTAPSGPVTSARTVLFPSSTLTVPVAV
jgi:hypothetical protein